MGIMTAFTDELVKIAAAAEVGKKALPLLKAYGKPAALIGSGALAYHLGNKEVDKYMLGRRVYEQMQAQGA
jgi:hypothetical protein